MRHQRAVITALLLAGLLTSHSTVASEDISEQALNQKLSLAKKMVTKISHQTQANKITDGAWLAPYKASINKINLTQQAMYQGNNQVANQILTDIFALITDSKAKLSQQYPDIALLTSYYQQRTKALNSFKSSLQATLKLKSDAKAQQALELAQKMQRQSKRNVTGDIHQAITQLEQAYELVISQITRLRHNETVVISLNFETSQDEYLYDLKRVESFKLLLEMQLAKHTPDTASLGLISSDQKSAKDFEAQAHSLAANNNYQQALVKIAQTIKSQQRALRTSGLNIM